MEEQKLRKKIKHSPASTSNSSGSDGDRRTSRERRKDKKKRKEEGRRKEKRKHRKKRQHSSSSNSDSSSDDEKRSKKRRLLKEAKRILKSHKKHRNDASEGLAANTSRKVLTEEDYYEKNKEFSAWLKEERALYFSNLSADETRRLFSDFVQAWNSGKLSEKLYGGIHSAARTDHKWQFKGEKESLIDREEELEFMKKLEKSQKRKFHNEQKDLLDELLPKATGRERLLEKKSVRREEARQREESPELLREQDIMGGSDDFKQRLERERAWREKKAMEKNEALKEKQLAVNQKEVAAMDQFKALLNVSGGKITIPKRIQ
eukprot:c5207_g1_i1 orf=158-1114(+)